MNNDANQLRQRITELEAQLAKEQVLNACLKEKNQRLLEQYRLAQQKQFGQSSESFPGQGELFNEVEEIADAVEEAQQDISYSRKKPKRKPLPADLPREIIIHDLSGEEKVCDCCNGQLHKIGED